MRPPAPPSPPPRTVPGVGTLLRQAVREAWTRPREPVALLVAAGIGTSVSATAGLVLPLVCFRLGDLSEATQDEVYLLGIPATVALATLGLFAVVLTMNIGVVRAISQRLDGGPPIQLSQCIRLTWPRLPTVMALSIVWTLAVYLGLAGALVPGMLAMAMGMSALLAVAVHGLGIADAAVLSVSLFTEHPRWHLRAGGLWIALTLGPMVPGAVLWALGSSWGPVVLGLGSQLGTLSVILYTHFWLLAYKALVGRGRAPIWPSRA